MNILRRAFTSAALASIVTVGLSPSVKALDPPQGFPTRPIELVVVYPAGGGMDVTARILAREAERVLGHSFRVQNRTGGGGLVGHSYIANQAKPDGYTIGIVANPNISLDFLVREGDFDASSFETVAGINFTPTLWTVSANGPLAGKTMGEVIEMAKEKPGEIRISTIPNNVIDFIITMVESKTGAEFTRVPFQGGKPGVVAMMGGNIEIASTYFDESEGQIRAGEVQPIVVADKVPFKPAPDVPTMSEFGIDVDSGIWGASRFAVVPKGTPQEIKDYLSAALIEVMQDPQTIEAFAEVGIAVNATDAAETQAAFDNAVKVLGEVATSQTN